MSMPWWKVRRPQSSFSCDVTPVEVTSETDKSIILSGRQRVRKNTYHARYFSDKREAYRYAVECQRKRLADLRAEIGIVERRISSWEQHT